MMRVDGEIQEYQYEGFMNWNRYNTPPIPSIQEALASGDPDWEDRPHYIISNNPRIRLADGSHIWGYECWWGVAEGAPDLAEAQAQTEDVITFMDKLFRSLREAEDGNE